MGRVIPQGKEKIKPILSFLLPKTLKQIRECLEVTGFCHLWIAKYNVIARPLYQFIKEDQKTVTHILTWAPDSQSTFQKPKETLLNAPTLSLPTGHRVSLFDDETWDMALGTLTQDQGPTCSAA